MLLFICLPVTSSITKLYIDRIASVSFRKFKIFHFIFCCFGFPFPIILSKTNFFAFAYFLFQTKHLYLMILLTTIFLSFKTKRKKSLQSITRTRSLTHPSAGAERCFCFSNRFGHTKLNDNSFKLITLKHKTHSHKRKSIRNRHTYCKFKTRTKQNEIQMKRKSHDTVYKMRYHRRKQRIKTRLTMRLRSSCVNRTRYIRSDPFHFDI